MPSASRAPRPEWLRIRLRTDAEFRRVRATIRDLRLHTVCAEARCPNLCECWNRGTATFLILGDACTRSCGFCGVRSGRPASGVDPEEPARVAEAVARLGLAHAVVTSVTRDDLPDGGAGHFRDVVVAIRKRTRTCAVEVLAPDFRDRPGALDTVLSEPPEVFAHNVETVPRLYASARKGSSYPESLRLLERAAGRRDRDLRALRVKSSLMLGLGEADDEVVAALHDLRRAGVDVVTLGQYLQPTRAHLPVARLVPPEAFDALRRVAQAIGFLHVEAGPLVRSSYHAERHVPPRDGAPAPHR